MSTRVAPNVPAAVLLLSLGLPIHGISGSPRPEAAYYIRVNQVGYLPAERKVGLLLTNSNAGNQTFRVVGSPGGATAFSARVGPDRGPYGTFDHLYELSFSGLNRPGAYRIRLGSSASPVFTIAESSYGGILGISLEFFQVQRCGDTGPSLHGICHLKDGRAKDGPAAGTVVDASGGWHDAGDYLKFLINSGFSTVMLLAAYEHDPVAFEDEDSNDVPDVLDEARIGVEWIYRLWDPRRKILYYQVGDASDHDDWRMPEEDNDLPPRPVWACKSGKGANVAGKAAAALAMAASIWSDSSSPFHDADLAAKYVKAAKEIYAFGKTRPGAQSSTSGFYTESTWRDDMALAGAELYRATRKASYLNEARAYATAARNAYYFGYGDIHGLAHYEIARLDPSYVSKAKAFLGEDLEAFQEWADQNPFRSAVDAYRWGSATEMTGAALEALWYEELSGDTKYHTLALDQRDYILGANPWGVCFVAAVGTTYPLAPHHQVADLSQEVLSGFWDEGPVSRQDWSEMGISLNDPDEYANFQSNDALYHDDVADYATNEPTINANAEGIALIARMRP